MCVYFQWDTKVKLNDANTNKKILQLAISMHWHFIVYRIDENTNIEHQEHLSIYTPKNAKVVADWDVRLGLYKSYFMICDKKLPITTYYNEQRDELDVKHADFPVEKRFSIRCANQTGYKLFNNDVK